ncbi:hypothetical protein [Tissierella praeacuta]|uniref:hypothetical protein n=1 Tax=Tissierella praeacuta TaxID=43131 RepID=UPI003340247A
MGLIVIALIIINFFTVYKFIFWIIFNDMDDFNESLRYSFTPDIISLFRKEYFKDRYGEFKLSSFIFICSIITVIEYIIVDAIIQRIIALI